MKIDCYGIQTPAPDKIAPGTLVSGMLGGEPFVGLTVTDEAGDAVLVLSGGDVPLPSLVNVNAIPGRLALISGEVFIEPTDEVDAFRLPRANVMGPGALVVSPDGGLGIRVDYRLGTQTLAAIFDFETGKEWQGHEPGFACLGWRLMVRHPYRPEPTLLAAFDQ